MRTQDTKKHSDYLGMVIGIPVRLADGRLVYSGDVDYKRIKDYVDGMRSLLIRRDRIVWAIRFLKCIIAMELMHIVEMELADPTGRNKCFFETRFGSPPSRDQGELRSVLRDLEWLDMSWVVDISQPVTMRVFKIITTDTLRFVSENGIQDGNNQIRHSMDMIRQFCLPSVDDNGSRLRSAIAPHHKLNTMVWDRQSFYEMQRNLKDLSDDMAERFRGFTPQDGNPILEMEGFSWFDLKRGHSTEEGAAMGHCGNTGGRNDESQTILSYRENGGHRGWKPHLTFILHMNAEKTRGWLGEMKGKHNSKPDPKWHPAIVNLLKMPLISEVRGGGYLVDKNFCLFKLQDQMGNPLNRWTDLSDELARDLHDVRPEIWRHNGICQYCLHVVPNSGRVCVVGVSKNEQAGVAQR